MRSLLVCLCAVLAACGRADRAQDTGRDADPGEGAPPPAAASVRIEASVPPGTPDVYLSGDAEALGPWAADGLRMEGSDALRTADLSLPEGSALAYKFTLGTWEREAVGTDGLPTGDHELVAADGLTVRHDVPGFKPPLGEVLADPGAGGVLGTLTYWRDVTSVHLDHPRTVSVWLPPGYEETDARYRVVYMADGQNLFDPRTANYGVDWGVDEAMSEGAAAGAFEPAIVVATWSTPSRGEEYSPWHGAPRYARFLIEELKPRVDAAFRTKTGPNDTFHMGSSMGGLLSYHLVSEHPDVFSACGCVSTHFPLSPRVATEFLSLASGDDETPYILVDIADGAVVPPGTRYFFDYGTEGLDAEYAPVHAEVRAWLSRQGLTEGEHFAVRAYEGADHDEAAWRARVGHQLRWLLAGEAPG